MKRLFWILLLLNGAVFAYFRLGSLAPQVSSLKPEIHAEQIKLLSEQALESYPRRSLPVARENTTIATPQNAESAAPAGPAEVPAMAAAKKEPRKLTEIPAAAAGACYEWSSFTMARVNEAVHLAEQLNIHTQVSQTSVGQENVRYWIYKPPLASAEVAQTKADELRKLGVEDFFIVQDDPKWRNAISFGVFRDEKLADRLMADLKAKGVRLLIKSTRYGGQGQAVIKLQHVTAAQYTSLQKSGSHFPDTVLKEIPCP